MAAVKRDLYIALVNAGVPEETAGKLAAARSKLDVEATLVAALEAIGKVRKWQQTADEGGREMLAKNKPVIDDDRDREKSKVLMVCADRGSGPGQRRYRVDHILNSVEYHPGDFLTPDEVRVLCAARVWQVHISPEREPLLPREEWSR